MRILAAFTCCAGVCLIAAGCSGSGNGGASNRNRKEIATIRKSGGVVKKDKSKKEKSAAPRKEISELSNRVQVYSSPEQVQRVFNRPPDRVENTDDQTVHWYTLDSATHETLKLKYRDGRLIGKEIVHPASDLDNPEATQPFITH